MIREELESKQDQLFARMIETTVLATSTDEAARAQFVRGFIALAIDVAGGDLASRNEYLSSVIPSVKRSGMPLGVIVSGMAGVAMGGLLALEGEARAWWIKFIDEYCLALGKAWDAA